MSNTKQSSVNFIIQKLRQLAFDPSTHLGMGDVRVTQGLLDELEEQGKAMHKEEIKGAFGTGCQVESTRLIGYQNMAEQYYSETFNEAQDN